MDNCISYVYNAFNNNLSKAILNIATQIIYIMKVY
jgi:hypothetical protein